MALVKKLQPGGNIDQNALNEALNAELGTYNLKSKDERKVRDALVKLRDFSATSGNSFTADQLAQKFTVTGAGSNQFQGSPDEIKSNWFTGKLKINDDQDAMSVAAAIYAGAHKNIQPSQSTTSTTPSKMQINIGDFNKYFVEDVYGGKDVFRQDFRKLKTNDLRQKEYLTNMKDYLDKYQSGWDKDVDKYDYVDKDKINELRTALGDGSIANWDKVVPIARKLGWNPNNILVNDVDLATYAEQDAKDKQTRDIAQATNYSTDLQGKGLLPNISTPYLNAGYLPVDQLSPNGFNVDQIAAFNEYIRSKKGFMFQHPQGQQFAIDSQGNPIQSENFDQFNPLTGLAWGGDVTTGFKYGAGTYTAPEQDNDDIDRGKLLDIPQFKGEYGAVGYSRKSKDEPFSLLNGNRDYTKYIELTNPYKGKLMLTKDAEGNYTDDKGTSYGKLKISGYDKWTPETGDRTQTSNTTIDLLQIPKEFENIKTSYEYLNPTLRDNTYETVVKSLTTEGAERSENTIKQLIGSIKHIINTTTDKQIKINSLKQLSVLNDLLNKQQIVLKLGGIIKAQNGTKADKYIEKYYKPKYSSASNIIQSSDAPVKLGSNIDNLLRGASGLDKAILAANVGMLAPGVAGVASGLVGTGLEAYRDATDGNGWTWGDTGNLALNLGLTAGAFIGLGGLKGVIKGAKLGKEVVLGAKVGKEIGDLDKLAKFTAKGSTEIKESIKSIKTFAKGETNLVKIEELAKAEKNTKVLDEVGKVVAFSKEIASAPKLLPSLTVGLGKTLNNVDKVGKYAVLGMGAMNIPAAFTAGKKIVTGQMSELSLDDVEALTSVAFAGKIGKHSIKREIGKRYGVVPGTSTPNLLTAKVNNETIEIDDAALIKRFGERNFKTKTKETLKTDVEKAFLDKYNSKIADDTKKLKLEDVTGKITPSLQKANSEGKFLREEYDFKKNIYLQDKGTEWAAKYKMADSKPIISVTKRPKKVTTPERKAKMEAILASRKPKQFLPPPTKSGVVIPPAEFKKPIPIKVDNELIKKFNKKVTVRKGKKRGKSEAYWMLKGGILKYQNAGESKNGVFNNTNNIGSYAVKNKNPFTLPFTAITNVKPLPGQITENHGYEQGYLDFLNTITEDQFKNYQPEINTYTKGQGSEYQIKNLQDLQRLAQDKQYGPIHNWAFNEYTRLKNTRVGNMTPMASKPISLKPTLPAPFGAPKADISTQVTQKPGVLGTLKNTWKGLDSTGIANGLMYLNTLGANAWIGNEQRKAISAGLFQLPYMPHQYIRADKPYSLIANKQAGEMRSQGKAVARATSDLNMATAAQLQGEKQAQDIITKGQGLDQERLDKVRGMQLENNASVDSYNTQTLGKNRGLTAEAMQKIHLTNANQRNAQNTATNNWLTAWDKNYGLNQYKQNMAKYFDMTNDPKLKTLSDEYTDFAGEKGKANALATYNANKANYDKNQMSAGIHGGTQYKPFEESDEYKQWQAESAKKLDYIKLQMKPLEMAQQKLNLDQQMLYWRKEGGKMTKKEKIDIDNNKFNNTKRLKETELTYKAIMHNNEMLQKALIKVFK